MGLTCSTYWGDDKYVHNFSWKARRQDTIWMTGNEWKCNCKREVYVLEGTEFICLRISPLTGFCVHVVNLVFPVFA
jgi:hypothetical protein